MDIINALLGIIGYHNCRTGEPFVSCGRRYSRCKICSQLYVYRLVDLGRNKAWVPVDCVSLD